MLLWGRPTGVVTVKDLRDRVREAVDYRGVPDVKKVMLHFVLL